MKRRQSSSAASTGSSASAAEKLAKRCSSDTFPRDAVSRMAFPSRTYSAASGSDFLDRRYGLVDPLDVRLQVGLQELPEQAQGAMCPGARHDGVVIDGRRVGARTGPRRTTICG